VPDDSFTLPCIKDHLRLAPAKKNIFVFQLLQLFPRYVTVIYCAVNFKCKNVDILEYKGLLHGESHR